jgi:hypothetical protein
LSGASSPASSGIVRPSTRFSGLTGTPVCPLIVRGSIAGAGPLSFTHASPIVE